MSIKSFLTFIVQT